MVSRRQQNLPRESNRRTGLESAGEFAASLERSRRNVRPPVAYELVANLCTQKRRRESLADTMLLPVYCGLSHSAAPRICRSLGLPAFCCSQKRSEEHTSE